MKAGQNSTRSSYKRVASSSVSGEKKSNNLYGNHLILLCFRGAAAQSFVGFQLISVHWCKKSNTERADILHIPERVPRTGDFVTLKFTLI